MVSGLVAPIRRLPKQRDEPILLQMERFARAVEGQRKWAAKSRRCFDYYENKQWTEQELAQLASEGRPALTFNKISRLMRLLQGIQRQTRYDARFKPEGDSAAYSATADAISKLSKGVDRANKMRWKEAEVFRDGIVGARGYFDYRMDFSDNLLGNIKCSVLDPATVFPDPHAWSYDPKEKDGGWGYVMISYWLSINDLAMMMSPRVLKKMRSEGLLSFQSMPIGGDEYYDEDDAPERFFGMYEQFQGRNWSPDFEYGGMMWNSDDYFDKARRCVRVLEQQHQVVTKSNFFVDIETGDMSRIPENVDRNRIAFILEWANQHGNPLQVVSRQDKRARWTLTAGNMLLWDDWSPYRTFTVVPYFAEFRRGVTRGAVEDLIDAQDEVNKRRSAEIHITMTTANSGWLIPKNSLDEDQKDLLEQEGSRPGINIYYKGAQKPERIQPSASPQALEKLEQKANADLLEISGINDSALGQVDRVQSGRAIEARQRQTILGQEHAFDNLSLTRHLCAEKKLELIQDFYTEQRTIRILGEGPEEPDEVITINQKAEAIGTILNDVTMGKYNVVIDDVPASASFREAQFQETIEMAKVGVPVPPDVMIDASSLPKKEQIKQRILQQQRLEAAGLAQPMKAKGGGSSAPVPAGGAKPAPAGGPRPMSQAA